MANLELPAADMSEYGAICLHCRPAWISRGWRCTQCPSGVEHSDAVQITLESIGGRTEEIELPQGARVLSLEREVRRKWGVEEYQKIGLLLNGLHLKMSDRLHGCLRITVVVTAWNEMAEQVIYWSMCAQQNEYDPWSDSLSAAEAVLYDDVDSWVRWYWAGDQWTQEQFDLTTQRWRERVDELRRRAP